VIKFIIAQGIGFSPGSVKYMPTLGFVSSVVTFKPWEINNIRLLRILA